MKLLPTLLSALIIIMFCIQAGACRSSGGTSPDPTPPAGSYTTGPFEVAYGTTILQARGASVSPEFFPGVSARPVLQIGGKSSTIVGVMPPSFEIPGGAEIWVPREEPGK